MRDTTKQQQAVLNQVTVRAKELVEDLIRAQVESEETWTLKAKEAAVLAGITVFGKELLRGLLRLHETRYVPDTVPCRCGGQAEYQRQREGGVQTIVGEVRVKRAYYLCPDCHQGCCPLDEELEFCAGGVLAEKCHPLRDSLVKPNSPKGLSS